MTLRLRPEAEADIEAIALYIAEDSPAAALRWYDEIHPHCERIADMPGIGIARPEVRPGLRTFPAGNYLILYRQTDDGAEIVRVIHGARRWQDLL
ncbi:type II toxin-antitoxin system RelE/ParE family toxin [Mesorhizobium sp. M8A.F.Ca.ET.208.01.1.1]|uniref:type II toxin-antitoxin system RelE/ParE family toxin n=1 Tax=unclassified Mesorhizobium TaxID=325217 RepID=UPI001093A1BA|nr:MULTISPECIES: type II toxin-antitoxin system RelE/ParE family toxin [unclassified Mesorhizobium]TGQ85717.1 type II toxin-antitoxin system RelE/ParE family toxin [Mesorhizobium sp. M8A.F.Ca.ET.208.01.1.1]TGT47603.1 type II toxin-antitoxin system RelE/ParE family toxin [Mesorhizobium sp. M8A.F.Ca.ET.167.01.1.1]